MTPMTPTTPQKVGNDAGWHLSFSTAAGGSGLPSIGSGAYYASIEATLPSGLEGGHYRFVIEGITNDHYGALHDVWKQKNRVPLYVDLYLYWRDTSGPLGYLATVAGLTGTLDSLSSQLPDSARVARLIVTRVSRQVGTRRYEAVIEARETVYEALRAIPSATPKSADDPLDAASTVADGLGVSIATYPFGAASSDPTPPSEPLDRRSGISLLRLFEKGMERQSGRTGRGMYVIRDGVLHAGPGRLEGKKAEALDDTTGLADVQTDRESWSNDSDDDSDGGTPKGRVRYTLTLKGRPDIKPGDKVTFADPFGNTAEADSTPPTSLASALLGGNLSSTASTTASPDSTVQIYVSGVSHRLSRTDGFVTTVTGVRADPGDEWDAVDPSGGQPDQDPGGSPHADLAQTLERMNRDATTEPLVVAEVRAANLQGAKEPPSQTVDVWSSQTADDGIPRRARRLDIDRDAQVRRAGVSYLTPFAWGRCGLVLPRYPGTRVVLAHVGGEHDDPVDIGALWPSGHGPDTNAGDYWLILPAAVDSSSRQSVGDDDTPNEPSGKATNDLIDADGARTIEVGRLTVRVYPNNLAAPGTRPAPPDSSNDVVIEHEKGSSIVIDSSGNITITAAGDLTLTSTKGNLNLNANNVQVTVASGGNMNVAEKQS